MSILNNFKHSVRDLFRYPTFIARDETYDTYWHSRSHTGLNDFQRARAQFVLNTVDANERIMDIGSGTGVTLQYLRDRGHRGGLIGVDVSSEALAGVTQRGFNAYRADIREPRDRDTLADADTILLFEVLEHIAHCEEILLWALKKARRRVIFSVPNTGYIFHRLRLLFGKFPLQWRAHPSEHLRFWTIADLRWWLGQLGILNPRFISYKGFPGLNRIWPSLFAAGCVIAIERKLQN